MKPLRLALALVAIALSPLAMAQWQWIDKSGSKVFSDQPPPPDIPAANIIKGPGRAMGNAAATAAAPVAAPAAEAAPAVPKISGKDKALEEKRKQSEADEAERKKAEEQKVAQERAENCTRLKRAKAQMDSSGRIARLNEKGEREYMDDAQRASEAKRLEGLIARDCKAG